MGTEQALGKGGEQETKIRAAAMEAVDEHTPRAPASRTEILIVILLTVAVLAGAVVLAVVYGDLSMRAAAHP